jgi:hypothetical protein
MLNSHMQGEEERFREKKKTGPEKIYMKSLGEHSLYAYISYPALSV